MAFDQIELAFSAFVPAFAHQRLPSDTSGASAAAARAFASESNGSVP